MAYQMHAKLFRTDFSIQQILSIVADQLSKRLIHSVQNHIFT